MKNCVFIFEKDILFTKNKVFLLKRSKFLKVPTQQSLLFFSEILRIRSSLKCLQESLKSIFSELVYLRKQNKNKTKKSTHRSLDIATYNTCAKFQGKIINPALDGAPRSLCFLNKRHCFLQRTGLYQKSLTSIFQRRTSIIKQLQTLY